MSATKWNVERILRAGMVLLPAGMCVLYFGQALAEALAFFLLGAIYGALLYRVVNLSQRAFMVMGAPAFLLILGSMTLLHQALGIPAAGPWVLGFIAGGITGGYVWCGPQAGAEFRRKNPRRRNAEGSYPGGRQPAAVNAVCALLLLGLGAAHFLTSPTPGVGACLAGAVLAGHALMRWPKSQEQRFLTALVLPVLLLVLLMVAQPVVGLVFGYGVSAGVLIGGRYWTGPRFGEPRPPFAGQGPRRRKKRRPKTRPGNRSETRSRIRSRTWPEAAKKAVQKAPQ